MVKWKNPILFFRHCNWFNIFRSLKQGREKIIITIKAWCNKNISKETFHDYFFMIMPYQKKSKFYFCHKFNSDKIVIKRSNFVQTTNFEQPCLSLQNVT